ncbi:hypothetical protein FKN05_02665 [Vibrio sp. 1-1(7)]|nr:hypothetical protein [Vibrio sp. 1-1(7)]NNN71417.1 hypothetical protein [Vibrio sp. 12-2(3-a)]
MRESILGRDFSLALTAAFVTMYSYLKTKNPLFPFGLLKDTADKQTRIQCNIYKRLLLTRPQRLMQPNR